MTGDTDLELSKKVRLDLGVICIEVITEAVGLNLFTLGEGIEWKQEQANLNIQDLWRVWEV